MREPDITAAAAAAAAAVATTIPTTTTHGGMQPALGHCCDPLIRGSDAGGVRGEGRRFLVWISLLTAESMGADVAWRVMGFVLRVSSCFYLAYVENDWRIACWKLRWFLAVVLTKIMRGRI